MTNFANWYAYYKTRNQMMKTAVGQAFAADQRTTTGSASSTLSTAAAERHDRDDARADFTGTARTAWYSALYAITASGSTPIRAGAARGRQDVRQPRPYDYTGGNEVVQFPCQQNFMLRDHRRLLERRHRRRRRQQRQRRKRRRASAPRASGCVDTRTQTRQFAGRRRPVLVQRRLQRPGHGVAASDARRLARKPKAWCPPAAGENTHLHMNTYTLGLGVDGVMTYEPNYDKRRTPAATSTSCITGATGCPWNGGGTYVWPNPYTDDNSGSTAYQSRVDDLWHAAINGHGKYFSASDPRAGDRRPDAGARRTSKSGSAPPSAAATSTPNISQARQRHLLRHLHHRALVRRTVGQEDRHHHRHGRADADLEHVGDGRRARSAPTTDTRTI